MKKSIVFLLSFLSAFLVSAQDIQKIFPPDGFGLSDQEMRAHYFDSASNTIFCSTKIYNDTEDRFENHIVLYDATTGSIELIDSFFATSNVDFVNFNNFRRYNDLLFFAFGKRVWQYDFNTQTFDLVLDVINLQGFDIVGDLLIYYTPGLARFRSLLSNEVVTTYNAAYLDAFHLEGDDIYFYESDFGSSSNKVYQLVKYNIPNNSFETLFSASFSTAFSLVRHSNFVKLGDHLIYTINTSSGTASYVSIDISNNTINTDFTFAVPTQFQLNKPFLINDQVYITTEEDTYVSNGVDQPVLTSLGKFVGSEVIAPNPIYNNEIYRVVNRDDLGSEIWKTDGQTISLLKDIIAGPDGGMSSFSRGYEYNGKIYFANGQDVIYVSNGTEEGTQPLYDADLFTFVSVPPYSRQH